MTVTDPISVVVALLVRDGAVLMGERRPGKVYPLHWEFPGGKVEDGESLEEALRRELREELAIEIGTAQEWHRELATYSTGHVYDIHYFVVRTFEGEIHNLEFQQVLWITAHHLPRLLHLSGNQNILEKLLSERIPS
jgi:8-oxo-dGTP diphosphatase